MTHTATLPEAIAGAVSAAAKPLPALQDLRTEIIYYLPLDSIRPSPFNPRKKFDAVQLDKLADMIASQGVVQAIVVREVEPIKPGGATYEIVAGERRWRASRLLVERGYAQPHVIPASIRLLDDFEARSVALTENDGRTDLHPLEEAQAYENLLLRPVGGGEFKPPRLKGYTVEQLADRIGHKPNFVFGRLKLLELIPAAREAFLADEPKLKLHLKVAEALARMPKAEQERALPELLRGWAGEPYTHRQAMQHLRDRYMLKLAKAVFPIADAKLLPKAGACTTCPKRSSASPDLFADIGTEDMCLDSDCHTAKLNAHTERQVDQARKAGQTVVTGDAATKLLGGYSSDATEYQLSNSGHINLDKPAQELTGTRKPLRELLGNDFAAAKLVQTDGATPITIASAADIKAALKAKGLLQATTKSKPGTPARKVTADDIKRQRRGRIAELLSTRIFTALRKHFEADGAEGFPAQSVAWLRWMWAELARASGADIDSLQAAITGSKGVRGDDWVLKLNAENMARAVMMMVIASALENEDSAYGAKDQELMEAGPDRLAEEIDFDLPALRTEVAEEVDAAIRDEIQALADVVAPAAKKTQGPKKTKPQATKAATETRSTPPISAAAQGNTQPPAKPKKQKPTTPLQALKDAFEPEPEADKANSQKTQQKDETAKPPTTTKSTLSPEAAWPFPGHESGRKWS